MIESQSWRRLLVCAALAFATGAVFFPVVHHDFINFDDPEYVTENPQVRAGLSWTGLVWSFTRAHANNWHPLTWWSHMLDCQLFGQNAGAHHAVNVLFHIVNTILVFLVFSRMTGALWRSAMVAALFGLHPLHIESVAWIAERKDVLSTLFLLLTVRAYAAYVADQTRRRFCLVVLFLALGLMAKPMLVTLPFVLVLLDYWPLGRWDAAGNNPRTFNGMLQTLLPLVIEKWPLFALSAVSCVITFAVQQASGAVASVEALPVGARLANGMVSYWRYVGQAIWPARLAVYYPHPPAWSGASVVAAGLALVLLSLMLLRFASRRPFLLVGWLWFLGTLVPVIGFVQVGGQSMADRYTYVPLIGLFVAIVWLAADWTERLARGRELAMALALMTVAGCAIVTRVQLQHWKNGLTLFSRALVVTTENAIAHNNLATALAAEGRREEAAWHYAEALRIQPGNAVARNNLGAALAREGRLDAAMEQYQVAIRSQPDYPESYVNLGAAMMAQGRADAAITHFERALRLNPDLVEAHNNLGGALALLGRETEALAHFAAALQLNPKSAEAHFNIGICEAKLGRMDRAAAHFQEATRLNPQAAEAWYHLGRCRLQQADMNEAVLALTTAVRLKPDHARARLHLGLSLVQSGADAGGLIHLREAARLRPDWPETADALAWLLATSDDPRCRNGDEAVRLAGIAAGLTDRRDPAVLNTLAAAYAEAGQFDEAVATAGLALELARAGGRTRLAELTQARLELYEARKPLRNSLGR